MPVIVPQVRGPERLVDSPVMEFDDILGEIRALIGRQVSVAVGVGDDRVAGFAGELCDDAGRLAPIALPDVPVIFPVVPAGASIRGGEYGVLVLSRAAFGAGAWIGTDHGRALRIEQAGVVVTIVGLDQASSIS